MSEKKQSRRVIQRAKGSGTVSRDAIRKAIQKVKAQRTGKDARVKASSQK